MDEKRFALIIANSEYQDPDLQKLLAPSLDAEALAKVLGHPKIGEFGVKALINKRSSEVNEEIDIFFAGTLFKRPRATSIPSEFVNGWRALVLAGKYCY